MSVLSGMYGRVATWRRAWYIGHPDRRRVLGRPVVSVGNLSVGGSGKTPVVACLAALLAARGERPAILTRGYARRVITEGVLVAHDGQGRIEPVERTGDEPQMLARALPQVPILVAADRYLAGRLAEQRFDCTVHLLDDGFQHLQLARDVDLLLVSPDDLGDHVLPAGRLREPLSAARAADAVITSGETGAVLRNLAAGTPVFRAMASYGSLTPLDPGAAVPPSIRRVVAVAAIARPARFFAALRQQQFDVVQEVSFRDHHWFTRSDLERIDQLARDNGADAVVTTEKDAVRLGTGRGTSPPWMVLPMTIDVEPGDQFERWLFERLRAARAA